jgi:hypothetical protein
MVAEQALMNRLGITLHFRCARRHLARLVFAVRGICRSIFQR